jgi:long-subunit fatty acid transport protein
MGRAYVAVANDANAVWWNPGALAFTTGHDISSMYTKLVPDLADDVFFSYTSYAQHVEGWGGIGFSLGYLSYGKSVATDVDGNELGTFTSYELAPTLAYGTELMKDMGFGVALKLVRVDLAPADKTQDRAAGRGTTFAADLGWLYKVPRMKSSVGLAVQNLGPNIAYIDQDQSDPLGRNVKLGVGVTPLETEVYRVLLVADVNKSLLPNGAWIENGGGEFEFNHLLALRAGYVYDPRGTVKDLTYGLGLNYRGIRIDYASVPQSEFLARVNRFSASYHF